MQKVLTLTAVLAFCLAACNSIQNLKENFANVPPYERYVRSLEKAHLDETLLAKMWLQAGERALTDSIHVNLPFSESGYFMSSEPGARSYQFTASEGQVLTANGAVVAKDQARFFLDLFAWQDSTWTSVAHGDSTFNLTYEFSGETRPYLVRIQPELLASVYYTFSLSLTPILMNPVAGASNRSIGSFYGASRDGGKRSHEGVDIFAKKGTPVIAPADGRISRVGTSKLGGKVIWLQDTKRGHSYYFAHLDEQLVKPGATVRKGDVIGKVGNTGNARSTPPHLHFGIYQSRSKDPLNYIQTMEAVTESLPWDTTLTDPDFRTRARSTALRSGPGAKNMQLDRLRAGAYVKVIAHSNDWYRVVLPNRRQGFVLKREVEPLSSGKRERVKKSGVLLADSHPDAAPIAFLEPRASVEVLAHFENFRYIKTRSGLVGWLSI